MWTLILLSSSFVVLAEGKGLHAPLQFLTPNGTVPNNYTNPGYGYPPRLWLPMNHENVPKRKLHYDPYHPESEGDFPNYPEPEPEPRNVVVDNNIKKLKKKKEGSAKFLVVDYDQVIANFGDIEKAKERLQEVPRGWGKSRLIAEVDKEGNLQRDPHIVAGQKQEPQSGFNKWWRNWNDINRMMDVCEDYLKRQKERLKECPIGRKITTMELLPRDYCTCNGLYCFVGETCADGFCLTVDPCSLPFGEQGHCFAYFERWSYNQKKGKCQKFIYGGCLGNENNFKSFKKCSGACESENGTATELPNTTLNTELPNTTLNTELPNAAQNTELPNVTLNTESPNATLNTELPKATLNTKLPNVALHTESPNAALNTKLPNATLHTKLPNVDLHTKSPNAALNTKLPIATLITELPNGALRTKSPNATLNTELPNATLNLTSPEPIKQTRQIKKLVKRKKKNGKNANLHKKHPRKNLIVTSQNPIKQSEETQDVIKSTLDPEWKN